MATPHQGQLQGYGLPLSGTPATLTTRPLRVPRIAAALRAQAVMAKPKPAPPLPPGAVPKRTPERKTVKVPTRVRPTQPLRSPNPRDAMALISVYAKARKLVTIKYRKKTDNDKIIVRLCEPYSIRVKMTKHSGLVRYFYGFCIPHNEIHSFIIDRIISVEGTNRRFIPRWIVEL